MGGKCGFAGRQDWRLPNITELKSITTHGTFSPGVPEVFNHNCAQGATVLTGSCTEWQECVELDRRPDQLGGDTWSSTSFISDTTLGQVIGFDDASGAEDGKERTFCVRAVAGGL